MAYFLCLILLVGCASQVEYEPANSKIGTPKVVKFDCDFDVHTQIPNLPYEELGTISYSGSILEGTAGGPKTIDQAKLQAKQLVCTEGGDGVIFLTNEYGNYKRAKVIKYLQSGS